MSRPRSFMLGKPRLAALVVVTVLGVSCAARRESSREVRWVVDPAAPAQATVEARGLEPQWLADPAMSGVDPTAPASRRLLRVYARPTSSGTSVAEDPRPPMLGTYEATKGVLRFRPAFPLEPGMPYVAVLDLRVPPGTSRMLRGVDTATYVPPSRSVAPPAVVRHVYPSADVLPENLLKFYVHFSGPMSRGGVYRHVRLVDDSGKEVELPFLELDEELWDPELTRLTLFIDPGRIKRGVRPLEEIGPALEQGKRYTLVIGPGLVDAAGRALGEEFRKDFAVGPPDREPPDPAKWKMTPPAAGTRRPLTIQFPDPMDHALAERLVRVIAGARVVPGVVSLGDGERRWSFTPAEAWRPGRYEVVVQPTVEDLAGNNVGKPFEVEMDAAPGADRPLQPVRLPIEMR